MKKLFVAIFVFVSLSGALLGQSNKGVLRTGFVYQIWALDNLNDPIAETTIPIEIIYSIRDNITVQFNHSPAMSNFGAVNLSGLSDTWIRGSYAFWDNRALVAIGLGLPTGKTELTVSEMSLTSMLSMNVFKFRMPVFGQGLTVSSGFMYAYPINEKVTVGAGINYVYRGKYQYSNLVNDTYDPGDQFGSNIGMDYLILPNLRSNIDLIVNYYSADRLAGTKMFVSGVKFIVKADVQYQASFGYLWLRAYRGSKAKNETWNGQALVPEDKNYNITQRELEIGARFPILRTLSILTSVEIRSYIENQLKQGWADLYGAGAGYELQMSNKLGIAMGFKFFIGDGEFKDTIPTFSGFELNFGTHWKF